MYKKLHYLLATTCWLPASFLSTAALAINPRTITTPTVYSIYSIEVAQNTENTYPEEFISTYINNCINISVVDMNPSTEMATTTRYCQCTVDRIQRTFSFEQYKKLSQTPPEQLSSQERDQIQQLQQIVFTCVATARQ